jgi:hypothetical protein
MSHPDDEPREYPALSRSGTSSGRTAGGVQPLMTIDRFTALRNAL